jgi:hypothetical protein
MNKPVGSTNIATIDNLDGNGFWAIEEVETHIHIDYTMLDFNMSDLDIESDIDNEASYIKLASTEDEQALDLFGSDN